MTYSNSYSVCFATIEMTRSCFGVLLDILEAPGLVVVACNDFRQVVQSV